MSYFVGGKVVDGGYNEDDGFAINSGNGWERVIFNNHAISLNGDTAIAMGFYDFTDAKSKQTVTVEYTFGYKRCADGKPRIFLHHSSVPFQKSMSGESLLLAPLTETDVLVCQGKWANAITSITKTYFDKGDVITKGTALAKELYGYGYGDVLFKPSKTGDFLFRPKFEEAMSYFIGGVNVETGYDEDAGFWFNGGRGWSRVEFDNHKIEAPNPARARARAHLSPLSPSPSLPHSHIHPCHTATSTPATQPHPPLPHSYIHPYHTATPPTQPLPS